MVERQILQVALHLWTVRAPTKADYGGCAGYHRSFATQNSSSRTPILVMQAVPHGNARDLARWLCRRRAARQVLYFR